ncbi:hypothetical protein ACP4OV_021645 [Aristida adscensionis]
MRSSLFRNLSAPTSRPSLPRSNLAAAAAAAAIAMASSMLSDCSSARLLPLRRALLLPPQHPTRLRPSPALASRRRPLVAAPPPAPPRPRGMASASAAAAAAAADSATVSSDASAKVIDGKLVAKQIREEIAMEITKMKDAIGIVPGLAVILVGSRKDSQTYVRNKKKACEAVGIKSYEVNLPEDSSEEEVIKHIVTFNSDPSVHGILVQLPLPRHMNDENILNAVSIEKDVDGFHPLNIGRLAMQGYGVEIKGKRAVVIGRSNIVGMPAALLLQKANATVSIVHSQTKNPEEITRQADIVIAAVGVANLVRGNWIKPGAAIIDVGINPVDDPESPRGYRLVGDVCYEEASKVAGAITPVPGGVGPMTIAMLLSNTLESAKRIHKFK